MDYKTFKQLPEREKLARSLLHVAFECTKHPTLFRELCEEKIRSHSDPNDPFFMPFYVMGVLEDIARAPPNNRTCGTLAREVLNKLSMLSQAPSVTAEIVSKINEYADVARKRIAERAPGWLDELPEVPKQHRQTAQEWIEKYRRPRPRIS